MVVDTLVVWRLYGGISVRRRGMPRAWLDGRCGGDGR
jgi:hypothetical protein